jgi:hypothetical protein
MAPASTLWHAAFSFVVFSGQFHAACSAFLPACFCTAGKRSTAGFQILEAALALAVLSSRHQAVACAVLVFRTSWLPPATQAKCAAAVGPVQFERGLTLPSRGRPKPFGFRPPLMSNVRPRLKVTANQPVQRFCSSAFAKSSAPKKKLLVFARFGGHARQLLRRQILGTRHSASWCSAANSTPLAAHFCPHAFAPRAKNQPQVFKSWKRLLLWRSSALGFKRWHARSLSFEPLGFGRQPKQNAQR